MGQPQPCQEPESVTTEGLEDLFQGGTTPEPARNHGGKPLEPGLTLKEAVDFYKISEKSVRIRISQNKIPAIKVPGNNGPEWRIFPNGIPAEEAPAKPTPEPDRNQPGSTLEPESNWETTTLEAESIELIDEAEVVSEPLERPKTAELDKLLEVLKQQSEKLEAANFRIGYLEAQTEGYREQIKLLTCNQSETQLTMWKKFTRWFLGQG